MLPLMLDAEIEAASRLLDLLQREHTALKTRAVEDLELVAREKRACTDDIQTLCHRRMACLDLHGFGTGGVRAWMAACPDAERSAVEWRWRRLAEVMARAQRQNDTNGAIIAASRRGTEQALAILHGHDPRQTGLYDQGARTRTGLRSTPIGRV